MTNNTHSCPKLTWRSRCLWNRSDKFRKFKCYGIAINQELKHGQPWGPTTCTSISSVNCTCCTGQLLEHLPMPSTSKSPCRSKFHHWQSSWKQKAAKAQVLLPYDVFVTANPRFEVARPLLPEVWEQVIPAGKRIFWCNSTDFISQLQFLHWVPWNLSSLNQWTFQNYTISFFLSHLTITNCSWFCIGVVKYSDSPLCKAQEIPW